MEQTKSNPLGYESIPRLLARLAVPAIVALLVSSIYNMVDQIFIGHSIGYLGNAATNVAFPISTIALAFAQMPGMGGSACQNLYLGAGNKEEAENCVGNTAAMLGIFGVFMMVIVLVFLEPLLNIFGATSETLPYAVEYTRIVAFGLPFSIFVSGFTNIIRADGCSTYSMLCMVAGAVFNIIFDPIFMFVFDMGMTGAALATILGQILSCVIALLYIPRFQHIKLSLKNFKLKLKRCIHICSLGMANTINLISNALMQIVMNNGMGRYGALTPYGSDIPLACSGIMMKCNMLFISFVIGIGQGQTPIISYNYGAKQFDRVKKTYLTSITASTSVALLFFILFQFFPRPLISLFGKENELYMQFAELCFKTFLFCTFLNGVQAVTTFFFTGIGKPLKGAVVSVSRQAIPLIPLLLLLPRFFGLEGMLYAGPISDLFAFSFSLIMFFFEMRKINKQTINIHK